MPQPRAHGGAAIQTFPLNLPGFKGLNKQARGAVLGPEWATKLQNTVLDESNRVSSRKGWTSVTSAVNAMDDDIVQLAEYKYLGNSYLIATTANNKVWQSANAGATWTNITGTATVTDPNMQFCVFGDKILGFQNADSPLTYDGSTLSNITTTGYPTGGIALAAFGRVWSVDTPDTLVVKYSALLNETDWNGTDAGSFDLTSVIQGQDYITALAHFNGALVIFTRRNIIIYSDGSGSKLGLNPITAYVADTVTGIGCVARDSVINVQGDLWFLSDTGVQSLGRLIAERSNPIENMSKNVQDELSTYVESVSASDIRAVYSPADRFYLLSLPLGSGTNETGVAFVFDTRGKLEDGSARCVGMWDSLVPTAVIALEDLTVIMASRRYTGRVGTHSGYLDNSSTYVMEFVSGWSALNTPELKILKRIVGLLYVSVSIAVTYKWAFDFVEDSYNTASVTYPGNSGGMQWGAGQWGDGQWGGGVTIQEKRVAGKGTGEYIKVGFSANVSGSQISCQQIGLFAKQGRLK